MSATAFSQTQADYKQPRDASDLDLISEVRNSLIQSRLAGAVTNYYDTNHYIIEAANKKPEVQRYLLNRYWNLQLMNSARPSVNERFFLINDGSVDDWLRLFKQKVVPFVVENSLPVKI